MLIFRELCLVNAGDCIQLVLKHPRTHRWLSFEASTVHDGICWDKHYSTVIFTNQVLDSIKIDT